MKKLLLVFLAFCAVAILLTAPSKSAQPPAPKLEITTSPADRYQPAVSYQFHAAAGEIYVFEPGTGRVWKQFPDGFFKPLPYHTGAGVRMQFTPFSLAQELEEFRKQSK